MYSDLEQSFHIKRESSTSADTQGLMKQRVSVQLKTDKKDLLRIYSLSKHIYEEIKRLNQKNRDKKVLAKRIIIELQRLGI